MKGGTFASQINKIKTVSKVLKIQAFFMPHYSYVHGNHRKYGNCFEKITGQSSCKSVGSMIE